MVEKNRVYIQPAKRYHKFIRLELHYGRGRVRQLCNYSQSKVFFSKDILSEPFSRCSLSRTLEPFGVWCPLMYELSLRVETIFWSEISYKEQLSSREVGALGHSYAQLCTICCKVTFNDPNVLSGFPPFPNRCPVSASEIMLLGFSQQWEMSL